MIILDIIIASILGYAIYKGFSKGFIISVISFLSLIIGIYVAVKFSYYVKDAFGSNLKSNDYLLSLLAFVIVFILVLISLKFISKALTKTANAVYLGTINRIGGALFELLKMIVISGIIINIFGYININNALISDQKLNESVLYKPLEKTTQTILPILKDIHKNLIEEYQK